MDKKQLDIATSLVKRDFELDTISEGEISEEELLQALANQVAYMLEYRLEFLLSLMYRLDVPEHKVQMALSPLGTEAPNIALARLVMERQKQRAYTKMHYRPEDLGAEWDW